MDVLDRFHQAVRAFGAEVHGIAPGQWTLPTPNADWNVRDLVNHVTTECLWAVPLLAGKTIAEVGDAFEGDVLGADPVGTWDAAAGAALAAAEEPRLDQIVHLSFGDFPAADYLGQLTTDHAIHTWDLARAIGGNDAMDNGLLEFVWVYLESHAEQWRAAGAFGPRVDVPASADRLTQLLALTGRVR